MLHTVTHRVGRSLAPPERKTVLLVEDEPSVRALAREILLTGEFLVREASDGVEALEQLADRHSPIHLLLTDMMMPRMGGKELAERAAVIRPGMRILYMSGYVDELTGPPGEPKPGWAFLRKPFRRDALLGKVRELLGPD
ncbi:MAG TPA: response regulator [Candidatus Deferrimicrobiaceae bacterium]